MTNYQFLQAYTKLQEGIMFDQLFDWGAATVCYSQNDPSPFWNNGLVNTLLTKEQILEIEKKLTELKRKPAFYFENRSELDLLTALLKENGYKKEAEDCWMFHDGKNVDESRFDSVRKVNSQQELEIFLTTFDRCYLKDDPVNPYGELGDYLKAARIAWNEYSQSNRIEYFIVYKGENPVAVSTLTNGDKLGYISNVGSLVSVRGEGYGKLATMICVVQSKKNGNIKHCLATEEGTNPNSFYRAIGFKTKFTSQLTVKES